MANDLLYLVPPSRDSTDRLPNEPEISWVAFLHWVHSKPRCDVSAIEQATQFNWASRAKAYDAKLASSGRPKDQLARTFQSLLRLVLIESEALLTRALNAPDGVNMLTPKDISTLLDMLVSHPEVLAAGLDVSSSVNLKDATVEDIHKLQEARKIMQRLRSSG